jgi:hypothetical protein
LGNGIAAHAVYLKDSTATQASTDFDGYKVALTKAFSKRTTGYAAYVITDYAASSVVDNTTYVVGIRHSF